MTPEQVVIERILAIGAVTALVSTRVYQLILPQAPTLPAVRVQRAGGAGGSMHLRGATNLYETRVQVDAYAAAASGGDPYESATDVAAAICGDWLTTGVPTGLYGWQGVNTGSPSLIRVLLVELAGDLLPMYESEEKRLVRASQDYMLKWKYV